MTNTMASGDSNQLMLYDRQNIIAVTPENMQEYFQVVPNELGAPVYKMVANDKVIVFGSVCEASGKEIVKGILTKDEKKILRAQLEDALKSDDEEESESSEDIIVAELQKHPIIANEVCRALRRLSVLAVDMEIWRFDLVKLILDIMNNCPEDLDVQRAALNCLRRLMKLLQNEDHGIHLSVISENVRSVLGGFSDDKRILETALEILNHKAIRQCFKSEEEKDLREFCEILVDVLDSSDKNIAILVLQLIVPLSELLPNCALEKFSQDKTFVDKLFMIIKDELELNQCSDILKMALMVSDNLAIFLNIQSAELNLFQLVLERFSNSLVKQKVLSIIERVSRSNEDICSTLTSSFAQQLLKFLDSEHTVLSFLSATTLIRLLGFTDDKILITSFLSFLRTAIVRWDSPDEELIYFNSLVPLRNLLVHSKHPEIHSYVAWTLQHLCSTTNSKHYVKLMYKENLIDVIDDVYKNSSIEQDVVEYIRNIFYITGHAAFPSEIIPILPRRKETDLWDLLVTLEDVTLPEHMVKDKLQSVAILIEKERKIPVDYATKIISNIGERFNDSGVINKTILSCYLNVIIHLNLHKDDVELRTITRHAIKCMKMMTEDLSVQINAFDLIIDARCCGFEEFNQQACVSHAMDILFKFDDELFNEKCLKMVNVITSMTSPFLTDNMSLENTHTEKLLNIVRNVKTAAEIPSIDVFTILRNLSRDEQLRGHFAKNSIHVTLSNNFSLFMDKSDIVELILEIIINVVMVNSTVIINLCYLKSLFHSQNFSIAYRAVSLAITALHGQWVEEELASEWDCELPRILLKFKDQHANEVPLLHPTWFLCNNLLHNAQPHCQLYALWVLRSICIENPVKNCKNIVESGDNIELEILLEDLSGYWCSENNSLKDEITRLLREICDIIQQNRFCELLDASEILKELKKPNLNPHIVQCYIRSLSLQAETFRFNSSHIDTILNIFKIKGEYLGIKRECILFFARVAKYRSVCFVNSKIIEIIFEVSELDSKSLKSSLRYGFEFVKCWTVEEFGLRFFIIRFLVENFSKLNSSHRMSCPSVIKHLIPLKSYKSVSGWRAVAIDITPLTDILEMDVMSLSNLHVICCFRLLLCINCLSISCTYPKDIDQTVARIIHAFDFDDEIIYEGIALLASISRLDFYLNNSPSFVIDFCVQLVKNNKLEISFCAVACIAQISHMNPRAVSRYSQDNVIEVIEQWGRPNIHKFYVHKMNGYYELDYIINLRRSHLIVCNVFALWVIRQLYVVKNEFTDEGWELKNEITNKIYDSYEINCDNNHVKALLSDVTAVLRRWMN